MAEESGHNSRYEFEFKVPSLRLCIKVGRGHRDTCVGTWDLGTRYEKLEDIKYGTRGRVGRGNRDVKNGDAGDTGCERLSQKSEVNAISLSS